MRRDTRKDSKNYVALLALCEQNTGEAARHELYIEGVIEQLVRSEATGTSLQSPLGRYVENLLLGDARRRGESTAGGTTASACAICSWSWATGRRWATPTTPVTTPAGSSAGWTSMEPGTSTCRAPSTWRLASRGRHTAVAVRDRQGHVSL